MVGLFVTDFYFYRAGHLKHFLTRALEVHPYFSSASTSLEFFLALLLFIVAFTVIYVLGQIINGISALIIDRLIVKKLLKYPFYLYLRRCEMPETASDTSLFRNAVLDSSYLVFCLNLVPLVFLEIVVTFFAQQVPALQIWLSNHLRSVPTVAIILVLLLYLHFGLPLVKKPLRYSKDDPVAARDYKKFALWHILMLNLLFGGELVLVAFGGYVFVILLLPAVNLTIGMIEYFARRKSYQSPFARRLFFYARLCFTNLLYLSAKQVGYGDIPSRKLIEKVRDKLVSKWGDGEFFWATYLTVLNKGGPASQTAYHFLAMYGMVRNLCNATAFILLGSVVAFAITWPRGNELAVPLWLLGLCCLMHALFVRYLYMYAAYFNKYILRVAAFVEREKEEQSQSLKGTRKRPPLKSEAV